METKLFLKQKVVTFLLGLLCCFAFAACNEDMAELDNRVSLLTTRATVYMQDFTPAGDEAVGTEVMLTDKRDGIVYRCIKMADGRWWMGENLRGRFGTYVEGQPTETYGLLYDWDTAHDYVPEGWSLPTNAEWEALGEALGGASVAGDKMKSASGWYNSGNGTNSSGFNGLPGGWFGDNYGGPGAYGFYWSAERYNGWVLYYSASGLIGPFVRANRYSVRCILKESLYMQTFAPRGNEAVGTEVMLTDKRDSIVYRCIKMADGRWWMGENLRGRFGTYVEGQPTETYGLLYNQESAQNYVPERWSIPGNAEWTALGEALGGLSVAGGKMKQTGTSNWLSPNTDATNSSSWNGIPGGYYEEIYDNYVDKGYNGVWWSAESNEKWLLIHNNAWLFGPIDISSISHASVRCILNQ